MCNETYKINYKIEKMLENIKIKASENILQIKIRCDREQRNEYCWSYRKSTQRKEPPQEKQNSSLNE